MTEQSDGPGLISNADHRYDLVGLDLVHRATGETDAHRPLTRGEIDMPGFVEHLERSYNDTDWRPVRVWRDGSQPGENLGT